MRKVSKGQRSNLDRQGDGHLCVKFQYSTSDLTKILLFVLLMFKRNFLIFIYQKCESIMFKLKFNFLSLYDPSAFLTLEKYKNNFPNQICSSTENPI